MNPRVTCLIPVCHQEGALPKLFDRLYPVMDRLRMPYEILFVEDGSRDDSVLLLRGQYERRPDSTRVVVLAGNAGPQMAILAGFEHARGQYIITFDADLQNPPEEIPHVLALLQEGADYVETVCRCRRDVGWRSMVSQALDLIRERATKIQLTDPGFMLRGYGRRVVDAVNRCPEVNTFVPALAWRHARNPVQIAVAHAPRARKYVGRIRAQVRQRPRFVVATIFQDIETVSVIAKRGVSGA
jgi:undecaprenyl-phosphate 4-deoxy-4-formamido-L-arabinose transferase